jgi:hypothetical protein
MYKATELNKVYQREVPFDKKKEIYLNGEDNLYPERMDRFINNSVTARTATNLMIQNLLGSGFTEQQNKIIVNKSKQLSLYGFADDFANCKVRQRGVFVWVGWMLSTKNPGSYTIGAVDILPFYTCRIGKKDSEEYNGKILFSRKWHESKQDDLVVFDVYNPDTKVIDAQLKKAGSFEKYKGQVLFINDDSDYFYPLSRIDAVQQDCDSEHQTAVYKNTLLRKGFFGKTTVITRPLVDNELPKEIRDPQSGELIRNAEYYNQVSEAENFKKTIEDFVGAESVGGALHLEMDFDGENLEDSILFKNIESKIDDKLFAHTESSIRQNILIAFNNLPVGLIDPAPGVFGQSGEAIKAMQEMYWNNCTKEREQYLMILNDLWKRMEMYDNVPLSVTPVVKKERQEDLSLTEKAQSTLRGSVGGVTALLEIQRSVSELTTTYESGVSMIKNIFGYSEDVAREILGQPKIEPNAREGIN